MNVKLVHELGVEKRKISIANVILHIVDVLPQYCCLGWLYAKKKNKRKVEGKNGKCQTII